MGRLSEIFWFVNAEKAPSQDEMAFLGLLEARELLRLYAYCLEKDEWPGYPDQVQPITLPRWAWKTKGGAIYE